MNLGRFRARVTREWVILLLLPALAFRLLVPEGFMPAFGDGAELTPEVSVRSLLKLVDDIPGLPAGVFLDRNGEALPW